MITLNQSAVRFDSESHKYFLGEKELQGITGMIRRQLFPDEYKDVPHDVLARAAERGSRIHSLCEFVDEFETDVEDELVQDYIKIKTEQDWSVECSEYVVSDNEHFASPIDKVFRTGDDSFTLADIKTTYTLNEEYVRWQLSIYAYFFEILNPTAKVDKLFAIHLKSGQSQAKEVSRIPTDIIKQLLRAEIKGEQFKNLYVNVVPADLDELEKEVAYVDDMLRGFEAKKKVIMAKVHEMMVEKGEYTWKGKYGTFIRKKDSVRIDMDKKRFKEEHEELYNQYLKETTICGSVTYKIK